MHDVFFLNKNYWFAIELWSRVEPLIIYYILEARVYWNFFFQSISWNTISGAFHETWNTFMKYFYFIIKVSFLILLINKKIELTEKRYLLTAKIRSSRTEVFCKKGVLESFKKFTGKHLCQSLSFKRVAGLSLQLY